MSTSALENKKQVVSDLNAVATAAHSAVAADYQGLTVAEMVDLRSRAREQDVFIRVVKNTLARRALQDTNYACMCDGLTGPLVLAFSREDPGSAARLFKDFAAEHDKVEVKMVSINGECLGADAIKRLASLPTRDEALAMLMRVMQAPLAQFVRTLAAIPTQLVCVLAAIKEKKEQV